jgi:hypothetical protein
MAVAIRVRVERMEWNCIIVAVWSNQEKIERLKYAFLVNLREGLEYNKIRGGLTAIFNI